jgi:hypothetical protein
MGYWPLYPGFPEPHNTGGDICVERHRGQLRDPIGERFQACPGLGLLEGDVGPGCSRGRITLSDVDPGLELARSLV